MTAIEQVVVGATPQEGRAIFSASSGARVLSIGNGWTKLRIGFRMCLDDLGVSIVNPRFYAGVMSSPDASLTNGPLSATCSNFFGISVPGTTFTRAVISTVPYYTVSFKGTTKVATTEVDTATGGSSTISAVPLSYRLPYIFDLWKGSDGTGSWSVAAIVLNNSSAANKDVSYSNLVTALTTDLNNGTAYGGLASAATQLNSLVSGVSATAISLSTSMVVSETSNGALNSLVMAWDNATNLHLSELLFISH